MSRAFFRRMLTASSLVVIACVATPSHAAQTKTPVSTQAVKDAQTGFSYAIEAAPSWVVPAPEKPDAVLERSPMHYRIIDEQVRVEDKSVAEYTHVVRVVDDAAGLSMASQIELEFDPSYQQMAVHHLNVIRDGKRLDRLDKKRIHLLQRETQLERQMYDGRVTLSIIVDDVRQGDQIDFAYTVRGANPVFAGKFVHTTWLSSYRGPVAVQQMRLLAPPERHIQYSVGPSDAKTVSKTTGQWRETIIRREAVPVMSAEAGTPYSALLAYQAQFSEFNDWAEVARWGEGLFHASGPQTQVDQKVAEIKARTSKPSERLTAALNFVQKDIRYFGTEVGVYSHLPAVPDKIIGQRFGDCKDKVGVLLALLRGLDIPAQAVVVSAAQRSHIDPHLPTPLDFDHAIARVELEGQVYWLDATRNHQTGTLANRQSVGFGTGLVLASSTSALADLPMPYDTVRAVVDDRIRISQFTADPTLESRITYRGDMAELFREALTKRSLQDMAADLAEPYVKIYPKIKTSAPVKVEQSVDDDALTFVQTFTIPEFWRFPETRILAADYVPWGSIQALAVPKAQSRKDPFAFNFPGIYQQTISAEFPEDVFSQNKSQHFEESAAQVSIKVSVEGTRRRFDYLSEVRIGTDQLNPNNWQAYAEALNKIFPKLSNTLTVSPVPFERIAALSANLKAQEEAIRSKKVKVQTRVQTEALFKATTLTAEIDGGRLPPALQAQALNARGIQYGHLGQADKAKSDFEHALALAPDSTDIQNSAATNATSRQDFDLAIKLANQVLQRNPKDTEAIETRARARYFKKELAAVESDYTELLKERSSVQRGYPIVWLAMAMREDGQDPSSLEKRFPKDQLPTAWPRPLVDFALGRMSADSLVLAAKAESNQAESLCETYFYIGEKYHAEGDLAHAKDYWRKSVDQGVVEFIEDAGARFRLVGSSK